MFGLKIFLVVALVLSALTLSVNDFKPALFHTSQPSGFYAIDTGSPNSGQILALADLNGDKYTDYIAINNRSLPTLSLYYWNDEISVFSNEELNLTAQGDLSEVLVCDLNGDGLNELLVTFMVNSTYKSSIYGINCVFTCNIDLWSIDYTDLDGMTAVPFIFDRYSNGSVSIFTFKGTERTIISAIPLKKTMYSQSWGAMVNNGPKSYLTVQKHFASLIDVNGDCFSDIVLVAGPGSNILEFYIKNNHNGYEYSSVDLGKNVSWLNFADLNSDGATDLFFVSFETAQYVPYIIKSSNIPQQICLPFSSPSYLVKNIQLITLPAEYKLLSDSNIKVADFNFDGYPDFLGIFSMNSYRIATILKNKPQDSATSPVVFEKFTENIDPLQQVGNPYQTCLYDFTESGKLSVLVISKVTKSDGTEGMPRASIINNIIEDTLFIKILPLLSSSSDDFQSKQVVNAIGVTIQWRITKLDGDKSVSVLNQKSQWNYGTLQLPFSTNGLGRTNNYIEDLTVGYPGYGLSSQWTPIIPNSQLILLGKPDDDWSIETLLKDNSRVYDMIYISILCLLGMGVLIVFLNWRENQEDKRDHYNFIQMIR